MNAQTFLYPVIQGEAPRWKSLKIGLHTMGEDGMNSPPAHALGHHGLGSNVVGYSLWGGEGEKNPQGRVIRAVLDREITERGPHKSYKMPSDCSLFQAEPKSI